MGRCRQIAPVPDVPVTSAKLALRTFSLAGNNADGSIARRRPYALDLSLLGQGQCVVRLDSEVSDGAFQLGVCQQQLTRTEIAGALIDHRDLGPAQAVGAVVRGIEADHRDPVVNETRVLPGCQMSVRIAAARKQPITVASDPDMHPVRDCVRMAMPVIMSIILSSTRLRPRNLLRRYGIVYRYPTTAVSGSLMVPSRRT
jgi:hypothetical protein